MDTLVTVPLIINWITNQVQQKNPIDAHTWLDVAQKINVLIQAEQERLFEMEQEVAKIRNIAIESGESVAKAKSRMEATDEYKNARRQKALISRCEEMIKLAKIQARTASDMMRGL